jgi:hypothetical protein
LGVGAVYLKMSALEKSQIHQEMAKILHKQGIRTTKNRTITDNMYLLNCTIVEKERVGHNYHYTSICELTDPHAKSIYYKSFGKSGDLRGGGYGLYNAIGGLCKYKSKDKPEIRSDNSVQV